MKKFEYQLTYEMVDITAMNEQGLLGWEFVCVLDYFENEPNVWLWKREKSYAQDLRVLPSGRVPNFGIGLGT